ncbi:protein kinase domain-containing protein [Alteribacillus iranensis]|uniref:Serine/threonine protein kinase n=1 Tax=Alteribacillus iranensis TaxID=930128 RepID=A0A1I2FFM7_9BACI|nr:hypothetical protein [Alteribacillus iranensis]SFF03709.1 serine/threonine protein kinase [Alteribacillus iranensis]
MQRTSRLKNQGFDLSSGEKWIGKWNGNPYKIIKKLGEGATGTVYLVETRAGKAAVKIGVNKASLTSEINVLKQFSKVQGNVLGPSLIDVDDIQIHGRVFPFFCMEYLEGDNFLSFIQKKGMEWIPILMVQLLGDLDQLHRQGWVFGDLKPENIIVTGPPARVRWFDVGGTTKIGRSIKEYTEFYDRGYWGMGDRRAHPSYDLFAAAMIILHGVYDQRFEKPSFTQGEGDGKLFLMNKLMEAPIDKSYKRVITQALKGEYSGAQLMKKDVMHAIDTRPFHLSYPKKKTTDMGHGTHRKRSSQQGSHKEKKPSYKVEFFLTLSFLFVSSILYLMGQWI